MSIRKIAGFVLAALMLAACLAASGCTASAPEEPVVSYSNVPEAYWDMFDGGSFDEENIWATDDEQYAEMIKELKAYCEENYPGSIMLATDDKIIFAGGWNATEVDGETTVNPFTTYEAGSYTKQITAAAVLQLVEQGKLSLDDTMDKFFPQCPNIADVKVAHLMDMNAGIPDFFLGNFFFKGCDAGVKEAFQNGSLPDEDVLDIISNLRCNEPGSIDEYSNTNFWLLALIIEQVTGQPYDEYVAAQIFDPCGMVSSTSCEKGGVTVAPLQKDASYWQYGRNVRGAGDIHTNACDIIRWDRAFFGGDVLGEEMMAQVLDRERDYSCGWNIENDGAVLTHMGVTDVCGMQTTVYRTESGNVYLAQLICDVRKGPELHGAIKIVEEFLQAEQ